MWVSKINIILNVESIKLQFDKVTFEPFVVILIEEFQPEHQEICDSPTEITYLYFVFFTYYVFYKLRDLMGPGES